MTPTMTPRLPSRLRAPLLAAIVPAMILAGCTSQDPAMTRLVIDFPAGHSDVDALVPLAVAANAHEQLLAWSRASGIPVAIQAFSFGSCLDSIDGLPEVPGCSMEASAYWALHLDGEVAEVGMDDAQLVAGQVVMWTLVPLSPVRDPGSQVDTGSQSGLRLVVDPLIPTKNETVRLAGTVSQDAIVSAGSQSVEVAAGSWFFDLAIDHGQTPLTVTADDGRSVQQTQVVAIRLAKATLSAEFTSAVPPRNSIEDEVWIDIDSLLSAASYEERGIQHPSYANVHDVLVAWTQMGRAIEFSYHESYGFGVESIEGHGALSDWCYDVNGSSADLGITGQEFKPNDSISWHGCVVV